MRSVVRSSTSGSKRRGNVIAEAIIFMVVAVVLAILFFAGDKIQVGLNDAVQNDTSLTNQSKAVFQENTDDYPKLFDTGFLLVIIMLWIIALISAWFANEHPIFFAFTIILVFVVIGAGMYLGNAWEELASDAEFVGEQARFPIIVFVMSNLIIFIIGMILSVGMVLFVRFRQ